MSERVSEWVMVKFWVQTLLYCGWSDPYQYHLTRIQQSSLWILWTWLLHTRKDYRAFFWRPHRHGPVHTNGWTGLARNIGVDTRQPLLAPRAGGEPATTGLLCVCTCRTHTGTQPTSSRVSDCVWKHHGNIRNKKYVSSWVELAAESLAYIWRFTDPLAAESYCICHR